MPRRQKTPLVFLSHAKEDKKIVRRIGRVLIENGLNVFIDETSIKVGQRIGVKLQEALTEAQYLVVTLSRNAMRSKWVEREWLAKYHESIKEPRDNIIPLLLDACDIPIFLRDIKYADFRTDFETGISALLQALNQEPSVPLSRSHVSENVVDALEALASESVIIPFAGSIPIIQTLKRLPRSGKHLRLDGMRTSSGAQLPSRSLYDHVLSVAHSADCFFNLVTHGVKPTEIADVARCIAYHELNEVVLGDIPTHTNLNDRRRHKIRIEAERRLRSIQPRDRERISNEFIRMFLAEKNREMMDHYMRLIGNEKSRVFRYFKTLDKIDPIIGVWRYLHNFRGKLSKGPNAFIQRMHDFFANPEPIRIAEQYIPDPRLHALVSALQTKTRAKAYYEDPDALFEQRDLFGFSPKAIKALIEGRGMQFVEEKHLRRWSSAAGGQNPN